MSKETCAKLLGAKRLMRENIDSEIFFQKYILSEETKTRIESIKEKMKDNITQANPMWKTIAGEHEEIIYSGSEDSDDNDKLNDTDSQTAPKASQSMLEPSTQFYFTQVERNTPEKSVIESALLSQKCDYLESIYENLERNNGRLDFEQLENMSTADFIPFMHELSEKLSPKGIYNLCYSMNNMSIEQGMKYLHVLCTHLLLPKIIELEEPSRLLSSAICECIKKHPDEIQQFIFVPMLNVDLKDTSLISTIMNFFGSEKKAVLIEEFLTFVKELKPWHITVLQNFLSIKLTHDMINKFVKLFSAKALCYSKDKNFGKLILSFLKINNTILSEDQRILIAEIATVNETIFKKPIENILRNM